MTSISFPDFRGLSKPGSEHPIYEFLALNFTPDWLIRVGIRSMLAQKLTEESCHEEVRMERLMKMVAGLSVSPVAIATASANEQHYMVPTEFFQHCLGRRLKYSCAYFPNLKGSLDEAEEAMLALTASRAQIEDGQSILELGCGWGSLTLYLAEKFTRSKITAVSNSPSQRLYIEEQLRLKGFTNVKVLTADMNEFHFDERVDRVVSVEMFEHMKNYQELMGRIAGWLKPGGKLFVHIFTHKKYCYHYEDLDGRDWLTRNFFTGGLMPSADLLLYFQNELKLKEQWVVSGRHYQLTAGAWLANMDSNRHKIMPILSATYGEEQAVRWWVFWRLFFIACQELWGYSNGEEWNVSHYLFVAPP